MLHNNVDRRTARRGKECERGGRRLVDSVLAMVDEREHRERIDAAARRVMDVHAEALDRLRDDAGSTGSELDPAVGAPPERTAE